jgi:uncharacterized protein (TIGR02246 family)
MRTFTSIFTMAILAAALYAFAADDKDKKPAAAGSSEKAAPARPAAAPAGKSEARQNPKGNRSSERGNNNKESSDAKNAADDTPTAKYEAEEADVLKSAEAFMRAYAKRDARSAAALFANDAEYVDVHGETFRGRAAIEKALTQCFQEHPDCKLELEIDSIRFLSPVLAIEDGTTTWTSGRPGVPSEQNRYTAIHAKAGDEWQVASVREHGTDARSQRANRLHELSWLVGNWVDEDDDSVVHFDCRLSDDGNFLIRDFEVSLAGEKVISGTQRIGWDPIAGKLRAWTFDSQGGFFEGFWNHDGDDWVLSASGVTSDGKTASGRSIFTRVNGHTITWQAVDREIDGARMEDSEEFTLVRRGPTPE